MTKTQRKRKRRRRNRNLRMTRPQNKFLQLERIQDRLKEVIQEASRNGDWNNLQWPEGWNYEKYMRTRNYVNDIMREHRDGRMARIMGGQKQTEAFNAWLWEAVDILNDARERGELDVSEET